MARRPTIVDPRRLAWQVLNAVEDGAFADAALGAALPRARLEARDRALATQLVYGTLAWQGLLDHVLAGLGRAPERLDPPLRTVLRMALFQLLKLERIPDFAAVDTAVELAKGVASGSASGLVNALLRRFLRAGKRVDLPPESDRVAHLAIATSHPRWLVERWVDELGASEAAALLAADNAPAPTVLRVNPARASRAEVLAALAEAGIAARPARFAELGIALEQAADPVALPGWDSGRFAVQGEASQLVVDMLGATAGARVLDVCAAPGGKALAIATLVGGAGVTVAFDRRRSGLQRLRAEAARLGCSVLVAQADATLPPLGLATRFDAVLVDAPCSGLGTLRQHPEIRWRRRREDLAARATLQAALLTAAARAVRRGGVLVYATCTLSRLENEGVVERFLRARADFAPDDPRPFLPAAAHQLVAADRTLRTLPHRHGLDGFFAVRLRRAA